MVVLDACTVESETKTPYLLANVVFVPFQAVMPPPQFRRERRECWIQAVPKP